MQLAGELAVGFALIVITPPLGTNLAGYFYPRYAQEVLDDLFAQAVVIQAGDDVLVLIACDLIGVEADTVAQARKFIEEQIGVPAERVCIGATHIHTGPAVVHHDIPAPQSAYRELLPQLIGSAAVQAWRRRHPARAFWASGNAGHLCFNRRYRMKDGTVRTNPGVLNPDIVEPAGPTDPEVGILAFETPDGAPLGMIVNFSLHCDTHGGAAITAGYPHFLRSTIAAVTRSRAVTLFFPAPCGDVNHIDVTRKQEKGRANCRRIGESLAHQVLAALDHAQPINIACIPVARDVLEIPCRRITAEQKREYLRLLGDNWRDPDVCYVVDKAGKKRFSMERQAMRDALLLDELNVRARRVELWCAGLGDVAIAANPAELFVELGLQIKRASPFAHNLVFELANGSVGYVPTRHAFAEGSYETTLRRSSCLAEDAGERIVARTIELLQQVHRQSKRQ